MELENLDKLMQDETPMELGNYARQIIACQMEIKAIQDDIKQIKKDARDEGILVKEIDSAITFLKKELSMNAGEKAIQQEVIEKLRADRDVMDSISLLVQ